MKPLTDTVNVSDDTVEVASAEQNVLPVEPEKRPLEESEADDEGERKKCKIDDDQPTTEPAMSKRQLKKIEKQKKWLELKAKRKETNKEKKAERKKWKAQQREAGIEVQKVKTKKMADSTCKQRIVLDMSYDDMMSDKDLCKCSSQILRCYGLNRRMENPMQLYFCGYDGKIKEMMAKHNGSEFWDMKYKEDSFDKVFQKEEMVYLTSDSLNVLDSIDENKVYIIGGLVDHNSCKGASLKAAETLGIAHARLPIDEYINMKTRKILTINQVYEIITKVVSGTSWKDAFMSTLPKRKIFSAKEEEDNLGNENDSTDDRNEENNCEVTENLDDNAEQSTPI